jgi:hypothetical protein
MKKVFSAAHFGSGMLISGATIYKLIHDQNHKNLSDFRTQGRKICQALRKIEGVFKVVTSNNNPVREKSEFNPEIAPKTGTLYFIPADKIQTALTAVGVIN